MSGKSGAPPSGQQNYSPYPVQPRVAAYPTQPYPQQQYAYPTAPMQQQAYVQQGPPPAYSAAPPPAYTQYPQAPPPAVYVPPPQGGPVNLQFDSGARFDGVSQPTIPPPPPGCLPTSAQMSALQGHPVNVSQRRNDIWTGGDGGGVSFGF